MTISFQSFFTGWIYKEQTFERNRRELFSFPNFFCFSSATCASFQNPNFLYHRQVPCLQQMHSCAFVTRLTEQFEHEHLQSNVKNSSNTRKIRLYKIINCLTSSIKLSHKIRTTVNHIATKL